MTSRWGHVVVTGGAGFLGIHVVLALQEQGFQVTILDDLSTGVAELTHWAEHFVRVDVRDRSAMEAVLSHRATDAVVHLAGRHRLDRSFAEPEVTTEVNLGGTASLLGAMRVVGLHRLIVGADILVYGETSEAATEESPVHAGSPLARSLLAVEALARDCAAAWGLQPVLLRLGTLAGVHERLLERPWEQSENLPPTHHLVHRLVRAARRDSPRHPFTLPRHLGHGAPVALDLIHVKDAAAAITKVVEAQLRGVRLPLVLNVANGAHVAADVLVAHQEQLCGRTVPQEAGEIPRGQPAVCAANAGLLSSLTGWAPATPDPAAILASAWELECSRKRPTDDGP